MKNQRKSGEHRFAHRRRKWAPLAVGSHRFLDVAEDSAVKVAAYLDLAMQKLTLCPEECGPSKDLLGRIVAMLSRT